MTAFQPGTHNPDGTASRHLSLAKLQKAFAALPSPPTDFGRLVLIVVRHAPGIHKFLDHVCLTPEHGVPGDEWNRRPSRHPDAQLAVIRRDVVELLANGQSRHTSGDNLIVDLDISAANLPVGTRLRVGKAIVEVTPKAHNGCGKFARRFGEDALRFVQIPATRHLNLRGIYWRVVSAGEVHAGAKIQILWRPGTESER